MKITQANQRGFCYGVKRAVDMALASAKNDAKVHTLGDIVHNKQVVDKLASQGIKKVNGIDEIENGRVVIRSHGVGPSIYKNASRKGLEIIDATCPNVRKAQLSAQKLSEQGYSVVIIGEKDHPEVKSIYEWAGSSPLIIGSIEEAEQMPAQEKIGVVAQTTFSIKEFDNIVAVLQEKSDDMKIERTICQATEQRQQAALELAENADVMIIIGGRHSANTQRLCMLCKAKCGRTYHIETAANLDIKWFKATDHVGITAGASTPEWVIEEVIEKMQEFEQVLKQDVQSLEEGTIVRGRVISTTKDEVFVDIGYKAEGIIPLNELCYPPCEDAAANVKVGDEIDVYIVSLDNTDGVILSKVKADAALAWDKLKFAMENKQTVEVKVLEVVKGGLRTSLFGVRGFIPASQVDIKFVEDLASFVGRVLEVRVIEVDKDKNKLIFSRKVILQEQRDKKADECLHSLKVGQKVQGVVTRLAKFGVFVDIGGIDGLVHISDLSWERVTSCEDIVNIGDKVEAVVLKVDIENKKVALSIKEAGRDPWFQAVEKIAENMIYSGKVTKLASFGAFVEIADGIEGLVHISELSNQRVNKVEDILSVGQEVKVKVLSIDKKTKRIALSISKVQEDSERKEYEHYLKTQSGLGITIGDKLGHLFKRED